MSTPSLISSQTEPRDSTFISRRTTRRIRSVLRQIGLLALIISGAILFLIPWAWIILTAGKDAATIFRTPPVWIPPTYHWEHFIEGWVRADFSVYYLNTLFISTMNVIAVLISCSLAAYAFARIRFPGRDALFLVVLSTMILPGQVTLIPLYIIFSKLGWVNTFKPLMVPLFFGDAFSIFLLRQFFLTISRELDDAALIDGCSRFGVLFRILLPLSSPALIVVAIFQFTWTWNDFLGPLIYLNSPHLFTITLGLTRFVGRMQTEVPYLMAMTIVSTLVPIAIFFALQRYFIQGVVITGIKG